MFCNGYHCSFPKTFHHSPKKVITHKMLLPRLTLSKSLISSVILCLYEHLCCRYLHKWNYLMLILSPFVSGLFHLPCFQGSSAMALIRTTFLSKAEKYSILYLYYILLIPFLMDICPDFTFALL